MKEYKKNYKKYIDDLYKKAKLGDARAMYDLGERLKKDEDRLKWWFKSAYLGNEEAKHRISCLYFYGHILSKNYILHALWAGTTKYVKNKLTKYEIQDIEETLEEMRK